MTRALARDGLIERRPDPADARATRLFLTERARELRPVAERILAELDDHVATIAGAANQATLKHALRTLIDL
jgi:DNA-binding MarR family transcriptional regulator